MIPWPALRYLALGARHRTLARHLEGLPQLPPARTCCRPRPRQGPPSTNGGSGNRDSAGPYWSINGVGSGVAVVVPDLEARRPTSASLKAIVYALVGLLHECLHTPVHSLHERHVLLGQENTHTEIIRGGEARSGLTILDFHSMLNVSGSKNQNSSPSQGPSPIG